MLPSVAWSPPSSSRASVSAPSKPTPPPRWPSNTPTSSRKSQNPEKRSSSVPPWPAGGSTCTSIPVSSWVPPLPSPPPLSLGRGFAYRAFLLQCARIFVIAASARISANPIFTWKNLKLGFQDPAKPKHAREWCHPRQDHPGRPVRWAKSLMLLRPTSCPAGSPLDCAGSMVTRVPSPPV